MSDMPPMNGLHLWWTVDRCVYHFSECFPDEDPHVLSCLFAASWVAYWEPNDQAAVEDWILSLNSVASEGSPYPRYKSWADVALISPTIVYSGIDALRVFRHYMQIFDDVGSGPDSAELLASVTRVLAGETDERFTRIWTEAYAEAIVVSQQTFPKQGILPSWASRELDLP